MTHAPDGATLLRCARPARTLAASAAIAGAGVALWVAPIVAAALYLEPVQDLTILDI
ncbi:MAG: hypothetical protein GKR94_19975 [Gammaproteobacteria bacterium]|nr:hypothetical protein [Gammaproteobacteria bacterium]